MLVDTDRIRLRKLNWRLLPSQVIVGQKINSYSIFDIPDLDAENEINIFVFKFKLLSLPFAPFSSPAKNTRLPIQRPDAVNISKNVRFGLHQLKPIKRKFTTTQGVVLQTHYVIFDFPKMWKDWKIRNVIYNSCRAIRN